jgi:hypothetical protein
MIAFSPAAACPQSSRFSVFLVGEYLMKPLREQMARTFRER